MNISIFASIWSHNLWDELILKDEIKIFGQIYWEKSHSEYKFTESLMQDNIWRQHIKDSEINSWWRKKKVNFRVFTYDVANPFFKQDNVSYLEYFPIWIRKKRNIPRNLYNFLSFISTIIWSDLIVIWWWWIIYDNEVQSNKDPLDQWIFRTKFFRFFRKKFIFYAVWINIKNEENKKKLKSIFDKSYKVYVRDSYSALTLKEIWIESEVIDDPVFFDKDEIIDFIWEKAVKKYEFKNLLVKKIESSEFNLKDLEMIDFSDKKVWVAFRSWFITKSWNKKIEILVFREFLNYLVSQNATVYMLPHSIHKEDINSNDLAFYKNVLEGNKYKDKVVLLNTIESVYEIYKNSLIDVCLSMRLHSMILSQVYDIPFIAFSYSKKTAELIKKLK